MFGVKNRWQNIIDACEKNKVRLSIGYRVQHEPNMQEIIRLTRTRTFGDVTRMTADSGYAGGVGTGWRFRKALGGGALYDMGVYAINGLRHGGQMEPPTVLSIFLKWMKQPNFSLNSQME